MKHVSLWARNEYYIRVRFILPTLRLVFCIEQDSRTKGIIIYPWQDCSDVQTTDQLPVELASSLEQTTTLCFVEQSIVAVATTIH